MNLIPHQVSPLPPPLVDVVLPVFNEEAALVTSVSTLREFLFETFKFPWRIVIADNGSNDRTFCIAKEMSRTYPEIQALHIDEKGRGRALKQAWIRSDADIVSYMDIDLSTGLTAFTALIDSIASQGYHLSYGSRFASHSVVNRSLKRDFLSRGYIWIIHILFRVGFTDAQCGFKAMNRNTAEVLLPYIQDNGWFFDTELMIVAEKSGLLIKEIPIRWVEDPNSKVKIWSTIMRDIRGLLRLKLNGVAEPFCRINEPRE